jgi:hypothetical protein
MRRYTFAREYGALLRDTPDVLSVTWFPNEAHDHTDGYINKQRVRFDNRRFLICRVCVLVLSSALPAETTYVG